MATLGYQLRFEPNLEYGIYDFDIKRFILGGGKVHSRFLYIIDIYVDGSVVLSHVHLFKFDK